MVEMGVVGVGASTLFKGCAGSGWEDLCACLNL